MPRGIPAWIRPEKKLTLGQRMWMAATLDCEGTISFHRSASSQWGVVVRVEMTDPCFILEIHRLCSGWLSLNREKPSNRKPHSIWQVSSHGSRWLLPQILPFLIVKKRQAELILEYLLTAKQGRRQQPEDAEKWAKIRDEMWELNSRGKWGRKTWSGDWRIYLPH
mgnify:CR=1 FL=1